MIKMQHSIKGVYLTVINYRFFLKVKINFLAVFASKTLFPKILQLLLFRSFSVDYATRPIMKNVVDTLL